MSKVVKFVCKEKRFIVGKEEWTFATNSKAFLLNFQEGVYTGSRTVNTTNILNYEAHLDRLGLYIPETPTSLTIVLFIIFYHNK